jgi:hypothetical protein
MGPRGLSHVIPFIAATRASPSVLPPVFLSASKNQMHAVIAADRDHIRPFAEGLCKIHHEGFVECRIMDCRIVVRRHDPQHGICHARQFVVVGEIARADDADAGFVHAALEKLLGEDAGLVAGEIHEQCIRVEIAGALQERCKVRIGERHPHRFDDLQAALCSTVLEGRFGLQTRRPVIDQGDDLLDAVLRRPIGHDGRRLRQREAGTHHIGRALHRNGRSRYQDDGRDFGLGGERRYGQRRRRDAGPEDGDFVVDDQLLGKPLRGVRCGSIILDNELDLASRHGVAVLAKIGLDAVDGGFADGVEGTGHRHDQSELQHLLCGRGSDAREHKARSRNGGTSGCPQHDNSSRRNSLAAHANLLTLFARA